MNASNLKNALVIVAVLAFVGTVAWFKENRGGLLQSGRMGNANITVIAPSSPTSETKTLPRLVDLGAGKCQACKEMAPILEAVRKEYAGKAVIEVIDVFKNPDVAESYDVRIIPTQIFFDQDGKEVWRHEGGLSKAKIVEKLKSLGA